MSRQPSSRTVPQPLEPLNVEELRFWLTIMKEHAIFIKNGLPCGCTELRDEAQAFCEEFTMLLERTKHAQSDKKFNELVNDAKCTVKDFCKFKRGLLEDILVCKIQGHSYPLFIDHMAREAEYVLMLLEQMKSGKIPLTTASKAQETLFWLRLMADHTKFIVHLLDPSERILICTAEEFAREFDDLYLQGRDFGSMMHLCKEVNSFRRFLRDVRAAVMRLRNFKKATHDMIVDCRLLGLIPAELADHVYREAEHFLMVLSLMDKGIMKHVLEPCADGCADWESLPEEREVIQTVEESAAENELVMPEEFGDLTEREEELIVPVTEPAAAFEFEPPLPTAEELPVDPSAETEKPTVAVQSPDKKTKPVTGKTSKTVHAKTTKQDPPPPLTKPKYKWGDRWPRKLGKEIK